MGNLSIFNDMIEEKLMGVHTAFVATIVSIPEDAKTATIQPLSMIKQYGKGAKAQSIIKDVPILQNARFKLEPYTLKYVKSVSGDSASYDELETVKRKKLEKGDVVFCVCADRDISETKKGSMTTPSVARHHDASDAVIIGVI